MNHTTPKLHFGASFYPEHWDEARWPEDIRLMTEAGFTAVRMGEFAWSSFEPSEGEFHFDWLDRAITLLAENEIVTVLGTPTAGPPAWLTQKYPKALAVNEHGHQYEHGQRCHYCVNSPEYHQRTRSLVEKMAEHFGSNTNVIGWQFDNEFNTVCYCNTCRAAFQHYLMEKFGSLDALNEHWTTAYWSQTYSDWAQIPIPKSGHNPGLMLAFQQFITHSYKRYQKLQLDILRKYIPEGIWTTHNFMGWFPTYDHYEMSADLDLASWDWYVGTGHHDHLVSGATHDLTRGFKRRNFWLIETQPGNVNWSHINNQVDQGEARAMAWHAIGHGADAIHYWQWRSAYNGQEQYHGSLVDQSGQPRPFYTEAAHLGREIAIVSELLAGSEIKARVAILNDYNSRWSLNWQRQHKDFDYVDHLRNYYKPLAERNIPMDIISADAPLDGYRLVIAPALVILTPERVRCLIEFVEGGGNLVLTLRSGMKDQFNSLLPQRQPGSLVELTNAEVEEYYPLETPVPVTGKSINGESHLWAERLRILDTTQFTQVAARYGKENGWLDDQIAITVNSKKNAFVYYVGAYLDEKSQSALTDMILTVSDIRPLMETPRGVEVCQRVSPAGEKIYIIINHRKESQKLALPWKAHEHLSDTTIQGELDLSAYDVAILTRESVPSNTGRQSSNWRIDNVFRSYIMQNLIPFPASIRPSDGTYTLHSNAAIFVHPDQKEIRRVGGFLADYLRPATGFELPVLPAESASTDGILVTTDRAGSELGEEGYELVVETEGIVLRALHPDGLFRGVQTIRQLLPPAIEGGTRQSGPWQINCVSIQDTPRFGWRGVMLDVARHFFPVTAVKRLIDQMAYYKFNILHLHLTDDQGWRLMIHSWPRLAEYGGTTDFTGGRGGFYTQNEYQQIVEYAAAHYINVIPEVDMPAHMNSALASYAALNDNEEARPLYTGYEGGSSSLAIHNAVTYQFLEDTLREIAALTPAPYIHIGGDEAHSTAESDYKIFIERVQKIVHGLGKQCIGWEEVSRADLLPDTVVQYWWQAPLAQEAARRGHKLILSPASRVYLDIKYDASTSLGLDWTKQYIDASDAYDWDPASILEGVTEESVLGVEAELWTETIATLDDMDFMLFPRLPACAEIGWTPREKRAWEEYSLRLADHGQRLAAMGIKFFRSSQVPWE